MSAPGYTEYFRAICPNEKSWVHEQLSGERVALEAERDQLRAQRDALLEIAWLDTPDTPHETAAQWRAEFENGWERKSVCDQLRVEVHKRQEQIGQQLAACDCAAIMDTPETHEKNKTVTRENPFWSPAFESVMRRTTECIKLRAEVERLTAQAVFDGDHIHTLNAAFATRAEVTEAIARAERAEALLKEWNDAADASRQPGAFYDGYSEAQMRAMQAMLTKAEGELHALRLVCGTTDAARFSTWVDRAEAELATEREKVQALRLACERLRDCDWVITLPDRMDAVRDIARDALAKAEESK